MICALFTPKSLKGDFCIMLILSLCIFNGGFKAHFRGFGGFNQTILNANIYIYYELANLMSHPE